MIESVDVELPDVRLRADLGVPRGEVQGLVLFAHGSGSSRRSPRNRWVAEVLRDAGFVTVLLDLLSGQEDAIDRRTHELRFHMPLLTRRLVSTIDWLEVQPGVGSLPLGCFGASTGAAAALMAAAERPVRVRAVVSRGGRPDLAGTALAEVRAPTLLIVGSEDIPVLSMNEDARALMQAPVRLEVVAGATHLFEEPGALDVVARLAAGWFQRYLWPAGLERRPVP